MGVLGVVLAGIVVAALFSPAAEAKMTLKDKVGENEIKLQIYGFSQFEARGGEGWKIRGKRLEDGLDFNAQRIRVGFNYFHSSNVAGKLFLDFNQLFDRREVVSIDTDGDGQFDTSQAQALDAAGLPLGIKDAFVAYRWNDAAFIRLGMIKTPLGMSFTVPGWNLDNVQRSALDKGLVLERDFGLMLSGRLIGQASYEGKKQMKTNGLEMGTERQGYGFGYDFGVFNPAGRSAAVTWDAAKKGDGAGNIIQTGGTVRGDALAYVGRVHYDYGKPFHVEASFGVSEQAGGNIDNPQTPVKEESEDYEVFGFGIASELWDSGWELKFEYIDGSDVRGVKDWDQNCYSFTAGYMITPFWQVMVKTYQAESEKGSSPKTELGNTYVGFNFFPVRVSDKHRDLQRNKIVINYIITNGDDIDETVTPWNGIGGYVDDAWVTQWQYKF
jgi:hypothetical protein